MAYKKIGDYGIIGNGYTAALVSNDGSIDWCCLPRFDSPSVFAALLDDDKGGKFHIRPRKSYQAYQSYLPDTNILKTAFKTATGEVTLTDFMPWYRTANRGLAHADEIHRMLRCTAGEVDMEILFEPKFDYARGSTALRVLKNGLVAQHGEEMVNLASTASFTLTENNAVSHFVLRKGEECPFILRYGSKIPRQVSLYHTEEKLQSTLMYWEEQARCCNLSGPWQDTIIRSYLALHLLVYAPTGAILAAPTTSLPEKIGGERNWDYRYTWLRDAALTVNAFSWLGHTDEAVGFFNWLVNVCDICGPRAKTFYNIDFEDPLMEQTLDHLKGYRDSRPVRIGNDAVLQLQLDVFGEVLLAAYSFYKIGGYISDHTWEVLKSFVDAAAESWRLPDSGIWEMRSGPFHFVYSKLMCWAAVTIGIKLAEKLEHMEYIEKWQKIAGEIRDDILTKGWNAKHGAFTQHYGTTALDASNLLIPLYNFLPISDERVTSTIKLTVQELEWRGLLRRYNTDQTYDGLRGSEGAFLWCSFWLVRNLLRMDRLDEAKALYEKLLGYRNHLGLISEMVNPDNGEMLGNFPQALTHLAIIITGMELTSALEEKNWTDIDHSH
jgi:GH15 family glucan-1,4-alpha-glucosidase